MYDKIAHSPESCYYMLQWASSDCTRSQIPPMPSNKMKNFNSEKSYSLALNKQINSWIKEMYLNFNVT